MTARRRSRYASASKPCVEGCQHSFTDHTFHSQPSGLQTQMTVISVGRTLPYNLYLQQRLYRTRSRGAPYCWCIRTRDRHTIFWECVEIVRQRPRMSRSLAVWIADRLVLLNL